MANTYYLGSSGSAPVSPSFSSDWDVTSEAIRRPLETIVRGSTMTTKSYSDSDATDQSILFFQFVGPPMKATASGTPSASLVMRCSETSTDNNLFLCCTIRLVHENGADYSTPKILKTLTVDNTECATTLTSRALAMSSITSETIAEGDRLVVEIGLTGDPSPGASHSGSISYGDDSATDISIISDSTTAANNPILNFNTSSYMHWGNRMYLPSNAGAAAAVTPSNGAVWEDVTQKVGVKAAQFTPSGSAMTTYSIDDADVDERDILIMTYVTPPLNPFITDNLTSTVLDLTMRGLETSASNNLSIRTTIRAVQNDGTDYMTPKYILGSDTTTKNTGEVSATTLTAASWGATVYSSGVSIAEGDRLVFEIGMGGNPATTFQHDGSISLGDDSASDLDNGTTDTDADNPWLQLTGTGTLCLPFKRDAVSVTYDEDHSMNAVCAASLSKSAVFPKALAYSLLGTSALTHAYIKPLTLNSSMVGANIFDLDFTPTREPSMTATASTSLGRTIYLNKSIIATCTAGLSHRIYPDFFESHGSNAVCSLGFSFDLIRTSDTDPITYQITDGITAEITNILTNPH